MASRIRLLLQSLFSPEALAKTACWNGVHPIAGTDCMKFADDVEREFGERADANSELLPGWMKQYESVVPPRGGV